MIFSKQNSFVRFVIWVVVLSFVASIFVIAGMTYFGNRQQAKEKKKMEDLTSKGRLSKSDAAKPLAKVNDKTITAGEFFAALNKMNRIYPRYKTMFLTKDRRLQFLEQLINMKLHDQALSMIKVTPEETEKELDKFIKENKQVKNKSDLERALANNNYTLIQFENEQIKPKIQREKLLDKLVNPRNITEDMLKDYYNKHKDKFVKTTKTPDGKTISVIMEYDDVKAQVKKLVEENVTDGELKKYYNEHKERFAKKDSVKVAQILIKENEPKRLKEIKPTDEELKIYYQEHRSEKKYLTPSRLELNSILIAKDDKEIMDKISVTKEELKKYYDEHKDKFKVSGYSEVSQILINDKGMNIQPTDDELLKYYNEKNSADKDHKRWSKPFDKVKNLVKREYIANKKNELLKEKIESIAKEISNGLSFESAAKKYSMSPSGALGGKIGKIYNEYGVKGEYKPSMSGEVAFNGVILYNIRSSIKSLKVGEVSKPVRTPLGYHLLKIDSKVAEKFKELDKVKNQIENLVKIIKAKPLVMEKAIRIYDRTGHGEKFDVLATKFSDGSQRGNGGYIGKVNVTTPNQTNMRVNGEIAERSGVIVPEVMAELKKANMVGKVLYPVASRMGAHILYIKDISVPVAKPFESVKEMVKKEYIKMRDEEATKLLVDKVEKLLAEGKDFHELAKKYSDAPSAKNGGELGEFVKGEMPDKDRIAKLKDEIMANPWSLLPEFNEIVFTQPVNKPSKAVKTRLGYHIFLVEKIIKGKIPSFEEVKDKIKDIFTKSTKVSDDEIKKYYEKNISDYTIPAKIRIKSIVCDTEERAKDLKKRIESGKDKFDKLAKEFSIELATKDKGGDSGMVVESSLDPLIVDAVKKAGKGKLAGPVKISSGYIIAQLIDKKDAVKKPLKDVRKEVIDRLMQPKKNKMLEEYLKELHNKAKIEYYNENFYLLDKYSE